MDRCKVRFVTKGYNQVIGLDSFSHVTKFVIVRLFFVLATGGLGPLIN